MRERTYWVDHTVSWDNKFVITASTKDGANVYVVLPFGKQVMTEGTPQDAAHWNNIEESLISHEAALGMLLNLVRQNAWEVEKGTVTLNNTQTYPFNNSQKSVPLAIRRENSDYIVIAEVKKAAGNVGEIVVSDKLVNGFKLEYTGSAKNATIEYQIIGGYMK